MADLAAGRQAIAARPAAGSIGNLAVLALLWGGAAAALALPLPASWQAGLLLMGLVVIGAPHGVLDIDLALWAAPRRRRWLWLGLALALYLGLIALAGLAWAMVPAATLVIFLAAAAYHFGTEDAAPAEAKAPGLERAVLVAAQGGAVVCTPVLFHPQAVAPIFAKLADASPAAVSHVLATCAPALAAGLAGAVALAVWRMCVRGQATKAAELVGVAVLFAAAPPLFAFAVYFCGVHAMRHVLQVSSRSGAAAGWARAGWAARRLAPVGLGFLLLMLAAAVFARRQGLGASDAAVVWSFRALAALTLPHLVLTPLLEARPDRRPEPLRAG